MEKFDHSNLTIKQLRTFLMVMETRSVGNAAASLNLNQSTVSYSLDKLREAFADPLFVKQGRGIVPTEKAASIAPQVRDFLLDLDGLVSADNYSPATDDAEFTIATNVMELLPYCKNFIRQIEKHAPNSTIRILELGSRGNIIQLLESQRANLVISVRNNDLPKSLNSLPLISCDQVCFYDPDVRGPVKNVLDFCASGHATLDFGGTANSTIDHTLKALSLSRNVRLKAPNIMALAHFMKGTDLITTMQSDLHKHALSGFAFSAPPISVPLVNFDMIWHRRSEASARNKWLRDLVIEAVDHTMRD